MATLGNTTATQITVLNDVNAAHFNGKIGSATIGGANKGFYLNGGTPTAMTYELNKSVPADAVFTPARISSTATVNKVSMSISDHVLSITIGADATCATAITNN